MFHLNRQLALGSLLLALTAGAAAQPTITGINSTELPRSGRVAIEGSGFGSSGDVVIAGISAWTTTWTDTRVVAYVPESAPAGAAPLSVVTGGEQSNEIALTVTLRQPDGRVRWRFETDGDNQWWRPAVAPNGTIYIHTNNATDGLVYALAPSGGLKWVQKVNWYPYVPPSAGPDNACYAGSINTVYRITPTGQIHWTFGGQEITGAPTVGPDGMVYDGYEVTPGAYALDAATGQPEWSNDPSVSAWGMDGTEIRFGRSGPGAPIDRFYIYWDLLWAFSLDGDLIFTSGAANTLSHEPAVGADGTIYAPGYLENYLVAYSPDDGSILWQTDTPWTATISDLEIGPDDTLYFRSDGRWIDAYDPHAQSSIWRHDTGVWLNRPSLSPDGTVLVTTGGGFQDQVEFVKAFRTNNGHELWTLNLQPAWDPNFRHVPIHHPSFSPDSATAYVPTWTAQWPIHDGDPRATLFAVEIGEETEPVGDINGDGVVGILDFLELLAAWGACPPPCNQCTADLDGDCRVGVTDFLVLLANWD
jgi:outer membrane protein assembly factor BamB